LADPFQSEGDGGDGGRESFVTGLHGDGERFPPGSRSPAGRVATLGRAWRFQGFGLMITLATSLPVKAPAPPASFEHRRLRDGTFWQAIPRYAGVDEATFLSHVWQGRN